MNLVWLRETMRCLRYCKGKEDDIAKVADLAVTQSTCFECSSFQSIHFLFLKTDSFLFRPESIFAVYACVVEYFRLLDSIEANLPTVLRDAITE